MDTVELSFNSGVNRFEIMCSECHRMELWLWSMAPADWKKGRRRRESRLLARKGKFYTTAGGFQPAVAVIDKKRGVQHFFVYIGHSNGPAGVFRITRMVDARKLKAILNRTSRK